jgi:hypothetical protein
MGTWTELALKLAQAKRLGIAAEADFAMRELSVLITQTARRIHASYGSLRKQRAADFVAQAPTLVWKKIERFEEWYQRELSPQDHALAAKEYFSAWCYVELRYRYLDNAREQSDEQRMLSLSPDRTIADPRSETDDDNDAFELPPEELERVRNWDPLDGVILFCLTGLWDQLPAGLWTSWLERLGIEEPFPPEDYLRAPAQKKRAALAAALNVSRDVIYQRWRRLKNRFGEQIPSTGAIQ